MGLLSRPKKRLRGSLRNVFEYLMGKSKEGETRLFSVVSSDKKRDNGHKLKDKAILFKYTKKTLLLV